MSGGEEESKARGTVITTSVECLSGLLDHRKREGKVSLGDIRAETWGQ